jgi:FAD/FMN-containing dehydrogenase
VGGRSEFGVITEATLRLVSRPEVRHGFECRFEDWASAASRSLILAEAFRPWLTRLLLLPHEDNKRVCLHGVLSGRAAAVASLMKTHDLQESPQSAIPSLNARVAHFWGPDAISHQEHAFPLGNLETMGAVIASLSPDTPWLAWPEPGWLIVTASPGPSSA